MIKVSVIINTADRDGIYEGEAEVNSLDEIPATALVHWPDATSLEIAYVFSVNPITDPPAVPRASAAVNDFAHINRQLKRWTP